MGSANLYISNIHYEFTLQSYTWPPAPFSRLLYVRQDWQRALFAVWGNDRADWQESGQSRKKPFCLKAGTIFFNYLGAKIWQKSTLMSWDSPLPNKNKGWAKYWMVIRCESIGHPSCRSSCLSSCMIDMTVYCCPRCETDSSMRKMVFVYHTSSGDATGTQAWPVSKSPRCRRL